MGVIGHPALPIALRKCHRHERDTIHRARCHTKLATRALVLDYGVHMLSRPQDGVDGTGANAQGAANTHRLIDARNHPGAFCAALRIQGPDLLAEGESQRSDGCRATWWTAIQFGYAGGQRVCVFAATWIAASPALGLWQQSVDALRRARRNASRGNR